MAGVNQRFFVDSKGRIHEASVSESVARLKEMFPEIDPSAIETQTMMERAHRLLANAREAEWSQWGLTGSRFILLRLLYSAPARRQTMSEIASHMNLGPNSVTQLIDAMAKGGLVQRETASEDKRVIYASLTEKGEALFAQVMPQTAKRVAQAFAPLSANERDILRHLLAKLRMHLLSNEALLEEDHPSDSSRGAPRHD